MSKLVEHRGVVSAVGEKLVEVEFSVDGACAGCKAKALCGQDEGGRFVSVWEPLAEYYKVGEEVMLGVEETMGIRAAVWAYMVPFFILLGTLLVTLRFLPELYGGLIALGSMCLYYVVLFFFRKRIEKEIVFKVRKI